MTAKEVHPINPEYQLSWLLADIGETPQIGDELEDWREGEISRYSSRHGSYRYVFAPDSLGGQRIVSGLQLVSRDNGLARVANAYTHAGFRRRGYARRLLERSLKDFEILSLSNDRSPFGEAWAQAVMKALNHPNLFLE